MIPYKELCIVEKTAQTTHATPGTQSTVAHGLPYAPTRRHCIVNPYVADDSSDTAGSVVVVKTDATYVYVKSNKASATFDLLIFVQHAVAPNLDA